MTIEEKITWWQKHRNKVYGIILFVTGLLGGNADRLADYIPNSSAAEERAAALNEKYGNLKDEVDKTVQRLAELEEAFNYLVDELSKPIEVVPEPEPEPEPVEPVVPRDPSENIEPTAGVKVRHVPS